LLRQIDHIQRDDHRDAKRQQFADEHEIASEVTGVDDDEDSVGLGEQPLAREDAARDLRFWKIERQLIEPRQIDDVDEGVAADHRPADARAGRGAGKVGRLGASTAEAIEQGCLAGVRIADQGDPRWIRPNAHRPRCRRRRVAKHDGRGH